MDEQMLPCLLKFSRHFQTDPDSLTNAETQTSAVCEVASRVSLECECSQSSLSPHPMAL